MKKAILDFLSRTRQTSANLLYLDLVKYDAQVVQNQFLFARVDFKVLIRVH